MSIEVRAIRIEEIALLQEFLRDHWNAQHAFVKSAELLLWQHFANPFKGGSHYEDGELAFLGAWEGAALVAVLGEIPVTFAVRGRHVPGTWLALWKNRAEARHASAGIQLLHRVTSGPAAFIGSIGINARARRAYELFRFRLSDDLPLYVVLNPEIESSLVHRKPTWSERVGERLLARTPPPPPPGFRIEGGPPEQGEWDTFWSRIRWPLVGTDRSFAYMHWRYLTHPHYHYRWLRVYDGRGGLAAAGVYRMERVGEERVLHVVEFLGDPGGCKQLAQALCAAMREHTATFLGFQCARSSCFEAWRELGGGLYEGSDPAYEIPSLFQPVVPEYRPLLWGYRLGSGVESVAPADCYVTRSDGDRDRPSRIEPPSA